METKSRAHSIVAALSATQQEAAAYRVLLSMFPEPIIGIDEDSIIRSCNQLFADLLSLSVDDVVDQPLSRFTKGLTPHEGKMEFIVLEDDGSLRINGPKGIVTLVCPDGSEIKVRIASTKVAQINSSDPGIGYGIVRIV